MADLDGYGEGIRPTDSAARAEAETKHAYELAEVKRRYNEEAGALVHKMNRLKADHVANVEKMRTDNAEAIQTVQARASERVDGAQERVKVVEREVKALAEEALIVLKDLEDEVDANKESARREIHAQGKTIARMKGEIRQMKDEPLPAILALVEPGGVLHPDYDPITEEDSTVPDENSPTDDDLPDADPVSVPGENEETTDGQTE